MAHRQGKQRQPQFIYSHHSSFRKQCSFDTIGSRPQCRTIAVYFFSFCMNSCTQFSCWYYDRKVDLKLNSAQSAFSRSLLSAPIAAGKLLCFREYCSPIVNFSTRSLAGRLIQFGVGSYFWKMYFVQGGLCIHKLFLLMVPDILGNIPSDLVTGTITEESSFGGKFTSVQKEVS